MLLKHWKVIFGQYHHVIFHLVATLVSGSEDHTIKIWKVSSGTLIKTLRGHTKTVYSCNFLPCGNFIVSGSYDETIRMWKGLEEDKLVKIAGKTC